MYIYIIYRLPRNIRPEREKKLGAGGLGCRAGLAVGLGAGASGWFFQRGKGVWFCAYGAPAFLELTFSPKGGGW